MASKTSAAHAALTARTGRDDLDPDWVSLVVAEALAYVRLLSPCKRSKWKSFDDLPEDVQIVVVSAAARVADNPRGIRQETIGEYSYTVAGVSAVDTGFFTGPEQRIISSAAGCGGGLRSVRVLTPDVIDIDAPDVTDGGSPTTFGGVKPPGTFWEAPGHANNWQGRWITGG